MKREAREENSLERVDVGLEMRGRGKVQFLFPSKTVRCEGTKTLSFKRNSADVSEKTSGSKGQVAKKKAVVVLEKGGQNSAKG